MDSESNQDKLTAECSKKGYSVTFQMRLLAQEVSKTHGCQKSTPKYHIALLSYPFFSPLTSETKRWIPGLTERSAERLLLTSMKVL